MVQPEVISVKWKEKEHRFEVSARQQGEVLLQAIKKSFGIPSDKLIVGLTSMEGELFTVDQLTPKNLADAGQRFLLLLSSSHPSANVKIPLAMPSDSSIKKPHDTGRKDESYRPIFQEIKNLDSFFGMTASDIKPNTRLLLLKVSSKTELDKFASENQSFSERISK